MRARALPVVVLIASGFAILGACGDDKPSHEAFGKQVQAICAAGGERHSAVAPDFDFNAFNPETSDLATIVPVIEQHLAIGKETVAQLKRLEGPKDDEETRDEVVAIADEIHELGAAEAAAAKAGDRAEFQRLTSEEEVVQGKFATYKEYEGC